MKVLMLWQYYPQYLDWIDSTYPATIDAPFETRLAALLDDKPGWIAGLIPHWRARDVEARYIIVNDVRLQRSWATEHAQPWHSADWLTDVALAQVEEFQPDLIWIPSTFALYGEFTAALRARCGALMAWISCPLPSDLRLDGIDAALTSVSAHMSTFASLGVQPHFVLPAFDESVLTCMGDSDRDVPVSFVGNLSAAPLYAGRAGALSALAEAGELAAWGIGMPRSRWPRRRSALKRCYRGEAWGMEYYRVLARSLVSINAHGALPGEGFWNMRLFEATGSGALLLTECQSGLDGLFDTEHEIATYESPDRLPGIVAELLKDADRLGAIAAAGQARTLRDHSCAVRSGQVLRIMEDLLS